MARLSSWVWFCVGTQIQASQHCSGCIESKCWISSFEGSRSWKHYLLHERLSWSYLKGDEERFICVDNAVSSKGRKDKEILGTRWNSLCEGTSGICAKGERVEEDTLRECHDTLWAGHPGHTWEWKCKSTWRLILFVSKTRCSETNWWVW